MEFPDSSIWAWPTLPQTSASEQGQAAAPANLPNGFYAAKVETGISNDDYIEIISGLDADDIVYLNQTTTNNQNIHTITQLYQAQS